MFKILHQDSSTQARVAILKTQHGIVKTPVFMPVGTHATVKAMTPDELVTVGAEIILGNSYHLHIRPGDKLIHELGGLHHFANWPKIILTDSGGFQVFSLTSLRTIQEQGVYFKNHLDGRDVFISPEIAMEIQYHLGSDIVMAFDECPPYPIRYEDAKISVERTTRWAQRSIDWWHKKNVSKLPLVFGIVQGSSYENLRQYSAKKLHHIGFDGYAIGGISVGEPESEMIRALEASIKFMPVSSPRYAMGVGTPNQIVEMVARGVDMFDCVLPTRLARNGTAFTHHGVMHLKNSSFIRDISPIEENCQCLACTNFTRAYIRHLIKSEEILGIRLITMHNLYFYISLMKQIQESILTNNFDSFRLNFNSKYCGTKVQE